MCSLQTCLNNHSRSEWGHYLGRQFMVFRNCLHCCLPQNSLICHLVRRQEYQYYVIKMHSKRDHLACEKVNILWLVVIRSGHYLGRACLPKGHGSFHGYREWRQNAQSMLWRHNIRVNSALPRWRHIRRTVIPHVHCMQAARRAGRRYKCVCAKTGRIYPFLYHCMQAAAGNCQFRISQHGGQGTRWYCF